MRRSIAPGLAIALALAAGLAGCFAAPAEDAPTLARPRVGDRAEYAVSGHLVELARWSNGFPLLPGGRLAIEIVDEPALALDGYRARHAVYRVEESLANGAGAFEPLRTLFVSETHGRVVQSLAPTGGEDVTVAWDERGYPWLWGASLLHGEAMAPAEATGPRADVPANDGGPDDAEMVVRFLGREDVDGRSLLRADALARGARFAMWFDPAVPYPVRVEATVPATGLAPWVRLAAAGDLTFRADLAGFTRGAGAEVPPPDLEAPFLEEPTSATFEAWDRRTPPDGAGATYAPFLLADAVAHARTTDLGLRGWLDAHADAILYRATYFQVPGALPGSANHTWLVVHVASDDSYYEVQVERTLVTGSPLPGVTRVTRSAAAAPPEGAHGWFDTAALPERLLTIDSAIQILRATFEPVGVEIFLRSFDDPAGYAYYVDGGFEANARYTLIVNAQTGFMQAATGPVEPVLE